MEFTEKIGWVKLHRKLTEWEWYSDINVKVLFLHLLLIANYEDKRWRGIDLKKGSIITGISKLSMETGLSPQNIRTALKKLQLTNEITSKTNNQGTIIQIVKFADYQFGETNQQATNKRPTNDQQTANKRLTTIKEDKKLIKERYYKFIDEYKKIKGGQYRGSDNDLNNFTFWLKTYSPSEIIQAVKNHDDSFWADKINPQWLFRTKDTKGQPVDYIGQLLDHKKAKSIL